MTIRTKFTLRVPKLRVTDEGQIKELLVLDMRQAMKVGLTALLVRIPVWSGESRGSFSPASDDLGVANIINPRFPRRNKNPTTGRSKSIYLPPTITGRLIIAEWGSTVTQFQINEFGLTGSVPSAPWNSLIHGRLAYENELKIRLEKRARSLLKTVDSSGRI